MKRNEKETKDNLKSKTPSELRLDLVSKDWVVIATGRAKRPESFSEKENEKEKTSSFEKAENCPFCQDVNKQARPSLVFAGGEKLKEFEKVPENWSLITLSNKFPAVTPQKDARERAEGPYQLMDGVGFHEIVVTRSHEKDVSLLKKEKIREILDAYQERYLEFMNEKFVNYISIFHNHGEKSGATLEHPHSQIMAIPTTDPDIRNSIIGSRRYWNYHNKCIHCQIIEWDREDGQRIVFENEKFIALCPFASKMAFTVRIYPKEHLSYFERVNEEQKDALAEVFQVVTSKIKKALNSPSYNFFLRTSPCDGKDYSHYHWHFEILPRTSIQAGFEFGAGMEISTIEPEKAAGYLREQDTN